MIEEVVQVSRVEGGDIWVEASRQSACGSCSSKKSCGQGALSDWMSGSSVELTVLNPTGLLPKVGERVVVGLEEGSLIRASLLVYLLPLVTLVLFAVIARGLGSSENIQILAGLIGLAAGFVGAKTLGSRASDTGCYQPILLRLA
ncbi:MAG: hypothetical protein CMI01_06885 [Oceanospirillaceae bacterium]|nr:hypothetical protein [Oceanospirillaceae bacterium]